MYSETLSHQDDICECTQGIANQDTNKSASEHDISLNQSHLVRPEDGSRDDVITNSEVPSGTAFLHSIHLLATSELLEVSGSITKELTYRSGRLYSDKCSERIPSNRTRYRNIFWRNRVLQGRYLNLPFISFLALPQRIVSLAFEYFEKYIGSIIGQLQAKRLSSASLIWSYNNPQAAINGLHHFTELCLAIGMQIQGIVLALPIQTQQKKDTERLIKFCLPQETVKPWLDYRHHFRTVKDTIKRVIAQRKTKYNISYDDVLESLLMSIFYALKGDTNATTFFINIASRQSLALKKDTISKNCNGSHDWDCSQKLILSTKIEYLQCHSLSEIYKSPLEARNNEDCHLDPIFKHDNLLRYQLSITRLEHTHPNKYLDLFRREFPSLDFPDIPKCLCAGSSSDSRAVCTAGMRLASIDMQSSLLEYYGRNIFDLTSGLSSSLNTSPRELYLLSKSVAKLACTHLSFIVDDIHSHHSIGVFTNFCCPQFTLAIWVFIVSVVALMLSGCSSSADAEEHIELCLLVDKNIDFFKRVTISISWIDSPLESNSLSSAHQFLDRLRREIQAKMNNKNERHQLSSSQDTISSSESSHLATESCQLPKCFIDSQARLSLDPIFQLLQAISQNDSPGKSWVRQLLQAKPKTS